MNNHNNEQIQAKATNIRVNIKNIINFVKIGVYFEQFRKNYNKRQLQCDKRDHIQLKLFVVTFYNLIKKIYHYFNIFVTNVILSKSASTKVFLADNKSKIFLFNSFNVSYFNFSLIIPPYIFILSTFQNSINPITVKSNMFNHPYGFYFYQFYIKYPKARDKYLSVIKQTLVVQPSQYRNLPVYDYCNFIYQICIQSLKIIFYLHQLEVLHLFLEGLHKCYLVIHNTNFLLFRKFYDRWIYENFVSQFLIQLNQNTCMTIKYCKQSKVFIQIRIQNMSLLHFECSVFIKRQKYYTSLS